MVLQTRVHLLYFLILLCHWLLCEYLCVASYSWSFNVLCSIPMRIPMYGLNGKDCAWCAWCVWIHHYVCMHVRMQAIVHVSVQAIQWTCVHVCFKILLYWISTFIFTYFYATDFCTSIYVLCVFLQQSYEALLTPKSLCEPSTDPLILLSHSCQPLLGVNLSPEFVNLYFPHAGRGLLFFRWWQRHFDLQPARVAVERSNIVWNTHVRLQISLPARFLSLPH